MSGFLISREIGKMPLVRQYDNGDPCGLQWERFATKARNGLLALETPLQELVRTSLIPVYPILSLLYVSLNILAPHANPIPEYVCQRYLSTTGTEGSGRGHSQ